MIQKYIERPLLITGGRKFDLRVWVLVNQHCDVFLYSEGVLRVASAAYSLDPTTLKDDSIHLSNHCIAEKHKDFGKVEATNELWYSDFDKALAKMCPVSASHTCQHWGWCPLQRATSCLPYALAPSTQSPYLAPHSWKQPAHANCRPDWVL